MFLASTISNSAWVLWLVCARTFMFVLYFFGDEVKRRNNNNQRTFSNGANISTSTENNNQFLSRLSFTLILHGIVYHMIHQRRHRAGEWARATKATAITTNKAVTWTIKKEKYSLSQRDKHFSLILFVSTKKFVNRSREKRIELIKMFSRFERIFVVYDFRNWDSFACISCNVVYVCFVPFPFRLSVNSNLSLNLIISCEHIFEWTKECCAYYWIPRTFTFTFNKYLLESIHIYFLVRVDARSIELIRIQFYAAGKSTVFVCTFSNNNSEQFVIVPFAASTDMIANRVQFYLIDSHKIHCLSLRLWEEIK